MFIREAKKGGEHGVVATVSPRCGKETHINVGAIQNDGESLPKHIEETRASFPKLVNKLDINGESLCLQQSNYAQSSQTTRTWLNLPENGISLESPDKEQR